MDHVVIVDGVRTPIGRLCGALREVSAKDLAKVVMGELVERTALTPKEIDELIVGCVEQPTNAPNLGRLAALELGWPQELSAYMVARNCASGLQAIVSGCQAIRSGDADVVLVVGTENMSQMPYVLRGAREGYRLRHRQLVDSLWEMLEDPFIGMMMGETAEVVAKEAGVTREEQDRFALRSHEKAVRAWERDAFAREVVPVPVAGPTGAVKRVVVRDEGPDPEVSLETLAALPPVFQENGTVTAGNACGINDGAAALLLMRESKARAFGYRPRARIVSYAFVGLDPRRMGLGPVYAVPRALDKAGLTIDDLDAVELNEAFAAQAVACIRQLNLDPDKVNRYGGAIALGHPVGATGVRLTVTLMNVLAAEHGQFGVATLCVGGGLGGALVIENLLE